nr:WYL domain protein [uncultured bacterium]
MPMNKFGRYIWLVDLLRRKKRLTYEEISQYWSASGLGDEIDEELPWRTFMNHKKKVAEVFGIDIECDVHDGYRYYIENDEELGDNSFKSWLIDSYATLNQVQGDRTLSGRISFEQIPSGTIHLQTILQAMRENRVIEIEHQGFGKDYSSEFEIEPYHLKVVNRRWYVIARSPYISEHNKKRNKEDGGNRQEEVVLTYGLDRILDIRITDKTFSIPKTFSIDKYFEGCVGIIADKQKYDIERVVVKAYYYAQKYLETLPIHSSQKVIARDDESTTFEFHVRPTYDFLTALLQQADQIEILEPQSVQNEMKRFAQNILAYYE